MRLASSALLRPQAKDLAQDHPGRRHGRVGGPGRMVRGGPRHLGRLGLFRPLSELGDLWPKPVQRSGRSVARQAFRHHDRGYSSRASRRDHCHRGGSLLHAVSRAATDRACLHPGRSRRRGRRHHDSSRLPSPKSGW